MAERSGIDAELSPQVRAILFDPLSYLHPQRLRLPAALDTPRQRAVVNDMLISGHRLDNHWPAGPLNSATRQFLRHWPLLPQAAYLIGCQALRAALGWQGGLLRLPAWAQDFAAMRLNPPSGIAPSRPVSHNDLLRAGYSRVLAWKPELPSALAQRLPLPFPPIVDDAPAAPGAPDTLLLTLALQYAQRHPHVPPADSR
ncbi:type III secretion apparatus protein OrgA/MxiK [Chromobacterium vaccinii]|uniref:type III secretion apparatus protein OrgA/MxiK n=1 Tax=Chromobacterium vaccinii TaxID=1108595 RepID=UPI000CE941F2|nr:type III secretion apparatus protein OrgA/MxiK [Chromobacterium vaccinii]AVG16922.1 type III secretion apparatus protein OrgA/MxiK [Chromobacterium vaccinii]